MPYSIPGNYSRLSCYVDSFRIIIRIYATISNWIFNFLRIACTKQTFLKISERFCRFSITESNLSNNRKRSNTGFRSVTIGTINEIATLFTGLILTLIGIFSFIKLIHFSLLLFLITNSIGDCCSQSVHRIQKSH